MRQHNQKISKHFSNLKFNIEVEVDDTAKPEKLQTVTFIM